MSALSRLLQSSVLLLSISLVWLAGCAAPPRPPRLPKEQEQLFLTSVKPVLEYYCIECHSNKSHGKFGGLILETSASAMITGQHAPVIRPGRPDDSLLFVVLRLGHQEALGMPPSPDKISDEQLEGIRQWILAGAHWPVGPMGRLVLPTN